MLAEALDKTNPANNIRNRVIEWKNSRQPNAMAILEK